MQIFFSPTSKFLIAISDLLFSFFKNKLRYTYIHMYTDASLRGAKYVWRYCYYLYLLKHMQIYILIQFIKYKYLSHIFSTLESDFRKQSPISFLNN